MDRAVIAGDPRLNEIVYCYRFPSKRDRIKIGYSSRGVKRILEQSTGFPENPEVLFVIHHPEAVTIEPQLHAALAHKQAAVLGNEWFIAGIGDVLKVSPLLRKAARRQKWRSVPRLFGAGALFGVGLFLMPLLCLLVIKLSGKGSGLATKSILIDYARSPFVSEVSTFDLARAIVEYLAISGLPMWTVALTIASPCVWMALAYKSYHRQIA